MPSNEEIKNRIFNGTTDRFTFDKERIMFMHTQYMFSKVMTMFEYENLPDTLPQFNLENILLTNGHCLVTYVDVGNVDGFASGLYALSGNGGGKPNPYYFPTNYIVANPFLNISKTYTIGVDNVLCKNTSYFYPLLPLIEYYAHQLTENEISLDMAVVNSRIMTILTANSTDVYNACVQYMEDIKSGKLSTIQDNRGDFLEGIKTHPYASTGHNNVLTQIIENEQYQKASFLNEIGLNANYNMKRESINGDEAGLNEDGLTPLITDMLNCRKKFVNDINKTFNLNPPITVKLSGVYEKNIEIAEGDNINNEDDINNEGVDDVGTETNEW